MRRRFATVALILIAATAVLAAQRTKKEEELTTCHVFDPAKLKVKESQFVDRRTSTGYIPVWRIVTDYGLIVGTLATEEEADVAILAAKRFTRMCIIGGDPAKAFTYFER